MSFRDEYEQGKRDREFYVERARKSSLLTQPSLFTHRSFGATDRFKDPYQSVGSMGVENLASKLVLTLFPAGVNFMKHVLSAEAEAETKELADVSRAQIGSILAERTRLTSKGIEWPTFRTRMVELMRHLIVGGNGALQKVQGGTVFRFFPLTSYICHRDNADNILDIILREKVDPRMINPEHQALLDPGVDEHKLFTGYKRRNQTTFDSWQEIDGSMVPGTEAEYPQQFLPVIPARWEAMSGESYGRSFVEKVLGDLATLEGFSEALLSLAAEAARLVFLVDPAGVTDIDDLQSADNGEYRSGREQDIGTLKVDKVADLQTAISLATTVRENLRQAFFFGETVQRQGERVTATEVQFLASQLDNALGGTFSLMSEEIQGPLIRLVEHQLIVDGTLPSLPDGMVEPRIITGLEGLGRSAEMNSILAFQQILDPVVPPEEQALLINYYEYSLRAAVVAGMDDKDLLNPKEVYEQKKQQQQQAAMAQMGMPLAQEAMKQ